MSGGDISGNTSHFGSGVSVGGGTFTMSGGTISGNNGDDGGGVCVSGGTFTLSGGIISGNTGAGGVGVNDGGTFIMKGGVISGNTTEGLGGGVNVGPGGTFTMSDGTISGNSAISGGGVCVTTYDTILAPAVFTMSGGTISCNTVTGLGGGVYVQESTFIKTGGTITGYANDPVNGNLVKNGSTVENENGHAVYALERQLDRVLRRKETTAGPGLNLYFDTVKGSYGGGWDNSTIAFTGLSANGSATETTTKLILTLNGDLFAGINASDITLAANSTGAVKGAFTTKEYGVYELALSGITASGQVTVGINKKDFTSSPASRSVNVYCKPSESVSFNALTADGSAAETTAKLTFTFNKDIAGLSASYITLNANDTGAVKGALTRTGTGVYELAVNGIYSAGQITVGISKDGYNIAPVSRNVNVNYYPSSESIADHAVLAFDRIVDDTPSISSGITIYRSYNKTPTSATFTVENPAQYSDITWHINGTSVQGQSLTVHSMHYDYYSVGEHFLTLEVVKNNRRYSKRVTFNIAN
jgi:hypothetical protein